MDAAELHQALSQLYGQELQDMCEGLNREASLFHNLLSAASSSCSGGSNADSAGSAALVDPAATLCRQLLELLQVSCGIYTDAGMPWDHSGGGSSLVNAGSRLLRGR